MLNKKFDSELEELKVKLLQDISDEITEKINAFKKEYIKNLKPSEQIQHCIDILTEKRTYFFIPNDKDVMNYLGTASVPIGTSNTYFDNPKWDNHTAYMRTLAILLLAKHLAEQEGK